MKRIWLVVGGVGLALAVFVGVIALLWLHYLKQSSFYQAAMEFTRSHPELTELIGEVRATSRIPVGFYFESAAEQGGEGSVAFTIEGVNGHGWLSLSATRHYTHWIIDSAKLTMRRVRHTLETVTSLVESTELLSDEALRERMALAMTIQASAPEPHYALALRYLDREEYEAAEDALRRAIRIDSTFAPAYNDLGVALMNLRDYREALDILAKAETMAPHDPLPRINQAIIHIEVDEFRDLAKARALLEAAETEDDTDPMLYEVLAELNQVEGKPEEARAAETKAKELRMKESSAGSP